MALLKIVYYSLHPALHKVAEPVKDFDASLKKLIQDMTETMYAAEGVGLAAPQVGIDKQIAVIDVSDERNKPFCIINPEILEKGPEDLMEAGCLSIPGIHVAVPRATTIRVRAQDETGAFFEIEGDGLLSHCLQHEIDHLHGKLIIDYFSALKKDRAVKKMLKILRQENEN